MDVSGAYNDFVRPLAGTSIRGVIWCQGSNNAPDGMFHTVRIKVLVESWRQALGDPSLPFYSVQAWRCDRPDLPDFWRAQLASATEIPHCEIAHCGDLARPGNPAARSELGKRLARIALAGAYGLAGIEWAGPRFKSCTVQGGGIRVEFDHASSGLAVNDDKPLSGFEIAGDDGAFVPADARIDGGAVIVSSEKVPAPKAVRYGCNRAVWDNLGNKDRLPAYPFSTGK
jgi:sialate O-acetylesterase